MARSGIKPIWRRREASEAGAGADCGSLEALGIEPGVGVEARDDSAARRDLQRDSRGFADTLTANREKNRLTKTGCGYENFGLSPLPVEAAS